MAEPVKITKPRERKRRNFQRIVVDTIAYCEAGIAAITAFVPDGPSKDGQLDALRAVLKRLTGEV